MIAIIGAGVSGLALGCFLKANNFPVEKIFIFEATAKCGGVIQTIEEQGYKIETAATLFPYSKQAPKKLCDILNLNNKIIVPQAKEKYLYFSNKLQKFSANPLYILKNTTLSWRAKFAILQNIWGVKPATKKESLAEFFARQFGKEIFDKVVEPLLAGIYAGDNKKLSLNSCFPNLAILEKKFGSICKILLKQKKQKHLFLSFETGMQQLVRAMQNYLRDNIFCNQELTKISFQKKKIICHFLHKNITFDRVILSISAHNSAKILQNTNIKNTLNKIPYAPLVVCALGYKKEQVNFPPQGLGFLVPALESKNLLGGFFISNMFANRSSSKNFLLQLMLGGMRNPKVIEWNEEQILSESQQCLRKIFQIDKNCSYNKIIRLEKAIPQYNMQHANILQTLEKFETEFPIKFHSNAYHGISLADCIENSYRLAKELTANNE